MEKKRIIQLSVWGGVLIFLVFFVTKMFVTVNASEIVVVQYPNGKLAVYSSAGIKLQLFGKITHYKKSFQYSFYTEKARDESIKVRFNDGGHGNIQGSCRIDLPVDEASIIALHTKYGSQEAIESALIRPVLEKSVYMTGPLMSSKESSSSKRNDLLTFISDQAENGVYRTRPKEVRVTEEGADTAKLVTIVEILKDEQGHFQRQEISSFKRYQIFFNNLSIRAVDYDDAVEKQIKSQQELAMQVQTSMARAKTAEQLVYTTQKEGEAKAAQAKWTQEAIKAQQVTLAEQELEVQQKRALKALEYEKEQIAIGRGDGERKRLAMVANGALDAKLEAWSAAQRYMWDAFSKYTGNMVPLYQTGGGQGSSAMQFMELMSMKAAKDLGLDMTIKK